MKIEIKKLILNKIWTSKGTFSYKRIGEFTRVYDVEFIDNEESVIVNGIKHVFIRDYNYTYKLTRGNTIKGIYEHFKKMIIELHNGDTFWECVLARVLEKLARKTVARVSEDSLVFEKNKQN